MRSAQAGFLNQILEADRQFQSTREFLEYLQNDVLKPRLRIFLHGSGIYHVPAGATVLDAAFARDPKIGFRCSGAVVNGQRVPVSWMLDNGDLVRLELADKESPMSVEQFGSTFTTLSTKYAILRYDQGETFG
jgi:GTP pyrophosphokinase